MPRDIDFEHAVQEQFEDFAVVIDAQEKFYKITATFHSKSVEITWPLPLFEMFLDFKLDSKTSYSQSLEYYDNEDQVTILRELAVIARAFLKNEAKITTIGRFFKRKDLQFLSERGWISVFDA